MAIPEFSETQFVVGFLREYLNLTPYYPDPFWAFSNIRIPSTVEEIKTGADFIFKHYSHSVFYQFKRSHKIHYKHRNLLSYPENCLPQSFFDYYRFEVYNEPHSRQFEKLRDVVKISKNPNDLAYYVAPLFHTTTSFNRYFHQQKILENSVLIPCDQFLSKRFRSSTFNFNNGARHFILYNKNLQGKMLSKPQEIKVLKASSLNENIFHNSENGYLQIQNILNWCREDSFEKFGRDSFINEQMTILDGISYLSTQYNIIWSPIFNF